jgi:cytidylate kinase
VTGRPLLVAIDGPAGAGKSAAARALAQRLRLPYLDTGAMYRAVALASLRAGVAFPLVEAQRADVERIAAALRVEFRGDARSPRVLLDGEDVTADLRTPEVSQLSSEVSVLPVVRREMVRRQRSLAARGGGVVEGRDIGTVVFPDAPVKVFLTASPEVRARRRFDELRERGATVEWEEVLRDQRDRDARDAGRADSPMRPATDAFVLDTTGLSLADVVEALVAIVLRRRP